jgi:excisionase family DNA binding protein
MDNPATVSEERISPTEVGKRLGISVVTVYRWLSQGKIPSVKLGHIRRVKVADVEAFVARMAAKEGR